MSKKPDETSSPTGLLARTKHVLRRVARRMGLSRTGADTPGQYQAEWRSLLEEVGAQPTNASVHRRLGDHYLKRSKTVCAIAEYRTALSLEMSDAVLDSLAEAYRTSDYGTPSTKSSDGAPGAPGLRRLSAYRYQRLRRIAQRIQDLYPDTPPRVLDVGGGDGALCMFLPQAEYVLVEPSTNGLSGTEPAFPDRSFDVVSACHVLEHIPEAEREAFLVCLCEKTKGHVLLLGPFAEASDGVPCDQLIYDITKADWAAEHIACGLPGLPLIDQFAHRHGLSCRVTPNGAAAAVYWMVLAHHFARAAGHLGDLDRATVFFNNYLSDQMTNSLQPNDYLIEITAANRGETQGLST